ncbi:protein 4.1-like isoform X3 [Dreissena polymorpha]|uniref:protein 4.1-like isoform X3 n=1 Tax=Dreissena polymorpha TaxID=45954 RepID=UPI002264906A|nr:protein 4.1-like isoform X3 [Dreissena polymorpha]
MGEPNEPAPDHRRMGVVRSARQVPVRVHLLDDDTFDVSVDKRAVGWVLFDKVCEHLNILEKDYFGLRYQTIDKEFYWLNNDKKIARQMKHVGQNWIFTFEVKFFPADPAQLTEDLTRYQLCLQIRRNIVDEKLPASLVTYALLGSYTAQSELGDYDPEDFGTDYRYLKDLQFAPRQDKELLTKIAELHRQHKGLSPEAAELKYLENAQKISLYGVELHPAKDAEGKDIQLGVCANGLIVFKDKLQVNRFVWPKVLKISYRRNKYFIKIRPGEFEEFASLIGFKLLNGKYSKRLWKISVEHHSFFRFREAEAPKNVSILPRFGSRFRYSGRTQYQTRIIANEEHRTLTFDRVLSKRGTFAGRTTNMRKRDDERKQQREEMRRQPPPPAPKTQSKDVPIRDRSPSREDGPPEPKHAPPVAPKPKPAAKPKASPRGPGSVDDNASLNRSRQSLDQSFEDVPDRRSKMEKMHAVPTPLAQIMQQSQQKQRRDEDERRSLDRYSDDRDSRDHSPEPEEVESRPVTPEIIEQVVAEPVRQVPLTPKEKKERAKQEKERLKREKEEERKKKKAEEMERKRVEKERKAALAQEKKGVKSKSSFKGKDPKKDAEREVRERHDSKGSNDMGRDWDQAREGDHHDQVAPDRTPKRFGSFEKPKEAHSDDDDQPPTPPAPLPVGRRGSDSGSDSGSDREPPRHKKVAGHRDQDEEEEVSF